MGPAFSCPFKTFAIAHIVDVGEKAGHICGRERFEFSKIKWLDGVHQVVRHLLGPVCGDSRKADRTRPSNIKIICGRNHLVAMPCRHDTGCPVMNIGDCPSVKQPEGHINPLDLLQMIFI